MANMARKAENAIGMLVLVVVVAVMSGRGAEALTFPPYADFSFLVNGTLAQTPMLPGYGVEKWSTMTVQLAMWYTDYTGKALVLDTANHGISPETTCRRALANGTAHGYGKPAMIMQPSPAGIAGFGDLARDYSDMKWVGVPAVEISIAVWYLAKLGEENGIPVIAIVRDDDTNPISDVWNYATVVSTAVLLTAICLACFVVNFYKLYQHFRMTDGITTAKVFLCLDNVANFMRLWYVCINPYFVNRFAYTWTTMCTTIHVAITIICTLLLAMKWRELLDSTKMKVVMFLSTLRWPFIAISTVIFLVETISAALRGHWYDISKLSQASWSFLIVMSYAVCTLLFISGLQVLLQLSKAVGSKRRVLQLSHTTIFILISGVFLLAWATLQMASLIKSYTVKNTTILFTQVNFVFQMLCLLLTSLCQNWAMPIPTIGATPTGSRGTHSGSSKSGDNYNARSGDPTRSSHSKAITSTPNDDDDDSSSSPSHTSEDDSSVNDIEKNVIPPAAAAAKPSKAKKQPSSSSSEEEDDDDDDDEDDEGEELIDHTQESSASSSRS